MLEQFVATKNAQYDLPLIKHEIKQQIINALAHKLIENSDKIIEENRKDLVKLKEDDPKYDRLLLNDSRIQEIAQGLKKIAEFPSPIWKTLEEHTLPNGLKLQKKSVPIGVIGMIFESRPNVTIEAFALCFMSSNACVLKGGIDAKCSNEIFVSLIQETLTQFSVPKECILLMPHEREKLKMLLEAKGFVDVIIPRGSQSLIDYVKQNSSIPIIETGAGVVHVYFDESGQKEIGKAIITNAKTRRVSVCNALDCLIIHKERLVDLPFLVSDLIKKEVMLFADKPAFAVLSDSYPAKLLFKAQETDFGNEFLSLKMAIKTVDDIQQGLNHIRKYSSGHSEAIIAQNSDAINQFFQQVDAAVVYSNASTAFTDGGEFGMGAEIGISTQKLHVRGPFSMQHLVSSKWLVQGQGQIRS